MIIQKDINNQSISGEEHTGLWHLVFDDDRNVIVYIESVGITSTFFNLFVGTKEECDQYILNNELIYNTEEIQSVSAEDIGQPEVESEIPV